MSAWFSRPRSRPARPIAARTNSLIYVDWLSDGTARVKKTREEVGTTLPAGDPSLTGDAKASSITYNGQSCKA
jgi:hypothetical protein